MIDIGIKESSVNMNSHSDSILIDVSLKDSKLNPHYEWGKIPIPYSLGSFGISLFCIWEGLKVFENQDIDVEFFNKINALARSRSENKLGKIKGFRRGISGHVIFSEQEARKRMYIPTYKWILEHKAYQLIHYLRMLAEKKDIILLDVYDNYNIEDVANPLSTAFLLKAYLEGSYPYEDIVITKITPHYYCGRKTFAWYSIDKVFKTIPPIEDNDIQCKIDFDYL